MNKQKDFNTQSDKYVDSRKSFGVNDPYALKEIGEAHYQGAEYGYQYAIDKVCDILNHYCNRTGVHPSRRVEMIDHIRKEMEE